VINHIDVSSMLRKSVCELYSNLVTRPTGAAVRSEIEQELDRIGDRALTVIDFSHVGLLDFSCADEIVAKLLLQYVSTDSPRREVYFVFRGISESHMEAIEAVLERHQLALVTQHAEDPPVGAQELLPHLKPGAFQTSHLRVPLYCKHGIGRGRQVVVRTNISHLEVTQCMLAY